MISRIRSSQRPIDMAAVGTLALLGTAFLFEMVVQGAVPVARDIQLFFVPHKHIVWEALQHGEVPLWTPLIRTGYPVLANFQSGIFYPPHWLYAVLPFFTGFNLLIVLHLVLGGVGTYVLCRCLDFGPVPSWVAASSYMLGGYLVSLTNLINALQPAAWAPVMAAVLVHHVRSWRPSSLAAMVVVYLMGFLAGEPQTFAVAAVAALSLALVRSSAGAGVRVGGRRALVAMGVTALAVAGLAAAQVLPTLQMVEHAARGAGLTLEQSGRYSLAPMRIVHLVLPNDFSDPVYEFGRRMQVTGVEPWLYSVYVGLAALVLAWQARWDRGRRKEVVFWCGTAVAGVVLALGVHTPLFRWIHGHVPGFDAFRFPEKFLILTGLAVPMLAAHGTAGVLRRPGVDRVDAGASLAVLGAGLGAYLTWVVAPDRIHGWLRSLSPGAPMLDDFPYAYVEWGQNIEVALAVLVVAVTVCGLYRKGHLGTTVFVILLCVVVPLDFWLANRGMNPVVDRSFYTRAPAVHGELPVTEVGRTYRYRATPYDENLGAFYSFPNLPTEAAKWLWQQTMQPATGALWNVQAHDAMDAIHLDLVRASDELLRLLPPPRRRKLLRLGSVKYVYHATPSANLPGSTTTRVTGVPGIMYKLRDAVPRAYLAHARPFRTHLDGLNAVLAPEAPYQRMVAVTEPRTTLGRGATDGLAVDSLVDSLPGALPSDTVSGPLGGARSASASDTVLPDPGSARIVADEGEEIRVRVQPDTAAHLVLTDTWYPGWHAYVDGEERPLRRANYFFKAVRVRPGDETVVLRYRSQPLRTGAWVSGGSFVLVLAGLVGWALRRRSTAGDVGAERDARRPEGPSG